MNEKETPNKKPRRKTAANPQNAGTRQRAVKKKAAAEAQAAETVKAPAKRGRPARNKEVKKTPVKIIPLGGLNEIGKNMTVFECSNDMFILDCGLAFPDADMPGVDIVIPDFTYVSAMPTRLEVSLSLTDTRITSAVWLIC